MKPLYHYTIGYRLPAIVRDGLLLPNCRHSGGAISALWLSTHPRWEPSAVKAVRDERGREIIIGLDGLVTRGRGVFRIEVEPAQTLHTWDEYVTLSQIPADVAQHLYTSGRAGGADPTDWWVCLHAIPRSEWRRIEMWEPTDARWYECE